MGTKENTVEHMKARDYLDIHAKDNMVSWNAESFERSHARLYRAIMEAMEEYARQEASKLSQAIPERSVKRQITGLNKEEKE